MDKTEQFAAGDKTVHELVESHVERDQTTQRKRQIRLDDNLDAV